MRLHLEKRVGRTGATSWRVKVYVTKAEGGPRHVAVGTYPLEREAKAAGEEVMEQLRGELAVAEPTMTVAALIDRCRAGYWAQNVRPTTLARYDDLIRLHIKPALGDEVAMHVTPAQVADWQADLGATLSPSTVRQARAILHKAYSWAVSLGLLVANPVAAVEIPELLPRKPELAPLSDVARVIEASRGTLLYLPVVIAAGTGMRRGEVLALRWRDIDLTKRVAMVARSLSFVGGSPHYSAPKTAAGNRRVALPDFVVRALAEERGRIEQICDDAMMSFSPERLVCCILDGRPLNPDDISHNFYHLLRRNKLPHMRFHDLRHAVASGMLENGVRVDAVQQHLGHASPAITLGIYGHLVTEVQHEAAEQYGAQLDAVPVAPKKSRRRNSFSQSFPKSPSAPNRVGKAARKSS